MNLKETYNKIALDWHNDHLQDDWWIEGTQVFISLFSPQAHILDVGCAGGIKSKVFTENNLEVTGIDVSDKMIEIAKKYAPEANFLTLPLEDINQLTEVYDGVFLQAVLLHIPKTEAALHVKQLANKLKPGGYFYIAVKEIWKDGAEEEIKTDSDYGYDYQRFFSYYKQEEIEQYLLEAGLFVTHEIVTPAGKTNWLQVIARKPE